MFSDAGEASIFFDDALDAARSEAAEVAVLRNGAGVFGIIKEKCG